jgi:acrylyl-CoA reductase (NADPH)
MPRAILLTKTDSGIHADVDATIDDTMLDAHGGGGDVTIAISHSTINYKDALALTNKAPVVRTWPMVPGIDGVGTVVDSRHASWKPGDVVVHNGFGLGETRWGCYAQRARVSGAMLVRLPESMTPRHAMAVGTAGYTAMLCVMRLESAGVAPGDEVLVTGASGGVGSVAIALLSKLGFRPVALTGKPQESDYLKGLGAIEVLDRAAFATAGKPLQKERWAGVVDTVGSQVLANALAQTRYGGTVAACGLAQGADLPTTVMPFILRNVTLAGVDSVMAPQPLRDRAWSRLARDMDRTKLESMIVDVPMRDVPRVATKLIDGTGRGRMVVVID